MLCYNNNNNNKSRLLNIYSTTKQETRILWQMSAMPGSL